MKTSDIRKMAEAWHQVVEAKKHDTKMSEAEDKTTPCPKCEGSMENHDPDCPSIKKEELKGNQHKLDKNKNGKIDAHDFKLLRKEAVEDNPANYQHLCAKQVTHEKWGAGDCIPTMHAEATEDGHVAWYDIMFEHGIEKQVPISELKVVHAENHMHSKKMKKEGWDDMLKAAKERQKQQGTGNFDKKKTSTGTVFTRKTNKDGTSKGVKESSDWPVFARIQEKAGNRAAHIKGATPPEPIDSKASKGEKDFVKMHGTVQVAADDQKYAEPDTKRAVDVVKVAPKRPGDQTVGDKTPPKAK